MSNAKNTKPTEIVKSCNCGAACNCDNCSCGCQKGACICQERNCQCGCGNSRKRQ